MEFNFWVLAFAIWNEEGLTLPSKKKIFPIFN
jgi:hypothetical protein